jgi:hypothetical protein
VSAFYSPNRVSPGLCENVSPQGPARGDSSPCHSCEFMANRPLLAMLGQSCTDNLISSYLLHPTTLLYTLIATVDSPSPRLCQAPGLPKDVSRTSHRAPGLGRDTDSCPRSPDALRGPKFYSGDSMTIETCITFCDAQNMAFAGVQASVSHLPCYPREYGSFSNR